MMRSLFSGVAGLKTHQTKMDVIGNNIANVNTVGYKSASVTFQELMYQTTQSASGANLETGRAGVNAKQIGLGVSTGAITNNVSTAGASQSTGNPFDIQITGDSFFIVSDGSNNYFTRAGAFYVDGAGNLAMTSNGYTVMGWQEDSTEPGTIKKDTVSKLQIMSAENMTAQPEATKEAYISGIIDKNSPQLSTSSGLIINTSFYDNLGYSYIAKYAIYDYIVEESGGVRTEKKLEDGVYRMELTDLLDPKGQSVKDYTDPPTDLSTWLSINAHGTDSKSKETVYLKYNRSTGAYMGFWDNVTGAPAYDSTTGYNATSEAVDATVTMTFDTAAHPNFLSNVPGKNASSINLSLKTSTMYDNNQTSTVAGTAGDYNGNYAGRKVGTMSGVSVQTDGKIYASYDNGTTRLLGQIAVASFANPSGLEKVGENLYSATQNSGLFDGIGQDVTSDAGSMSTGVLEMSNVDLSAEFTEMITTQRGFQANSRIITVSDSMLEELTNLKR